MKLKDFKPTQYKLLLQDGREVLGEYWENGKRYFKVTGAKGDEVVPSPNSGAYCPDFSFDNSEPVKVVTREQPVKMNDNNEGLQKRIKDLEDQVSRLTESLKGNLDINSKN